MPHFKHNDSSYGYEFQSVKEDLKQGIKREPIRKIMTTFLQPFLQYFLRPIMPILLLAPLALSGCGDRSGEGAIERQNGISRLSDTPIALVNGSYLYDTDVNRMAIEQGILLAGEALSVDDEAYNGVLDELIDQRLLALSAEDEGLSLRPDSRRRIAISRERILGNILVEEHLAAEVTEEEARKLYEAQIALRERGDEVNASHILVATKAEAESVAKRLDEGESLATLAYEVSIDRGTRLDGGDLGYFQAGVMTPDFSDVVFALGVGETSPPFETEFGWHIVSVTDRRPARQLSFDDMRDEIINYMTYDAIKGLLDDLRGGAEVEILVEGAQGVDAQGVDRPDGESSDVEGPDDDNAEP